MPATITRLRTREDRLQTDQASRLKQTVLSLNLPDRAKGALLATIDRETVSTAPTWTFVMISPEQHNAVVTWLAENSRRPLAALRLWSACFVSLKMDTGEITLTRTELAERVGIEPRDVSRIMGELSKCGAIIRHRDDHGRAHYLMNPRVATHLPGAERDRAQAQAPLLTLMNGGKSLA